MRFRLRNICSTMDLRNFNFCRPADNKFQNPFRMMSTATSPCMDFTMVPLNGTKLTAAAPQDFTEAKTVLKTAALKCHQPSVTIGGFVGSKSQTRSYISNGNQLYDVLIGHLAQIPDLLKCQPYLFVDRCFIAPAASPHFSSSQKPKTDSINLVEDPSTSELQLSGTESTSADHRKAPEVRSYAEVAKMPGAKGYCMRAKQSPIRRFQQNIRDKGRPRSIQGNWRERESMKDIRRDKEFTFKKHEDSYKHKSSEFSHKELAKNSGQLFRNFKLGGRGGNSCTKKSFQSNKRGEEAKNRIIHEKHPNFSKNSSEQQSVKCAETELESGGCNNWRCRQPHTQKSNPKQEMRHRISAEIREYTPPRSLGCLIKQLPICILEKINPGQNTNSNPAANLEEKCTEALNSIRESSVMRNLARLGCSPSDQRKDSTSSEEVVFRASECDSEDSFVLFENDDLSDSSESSDSSDSDWSELEECSVQSPWLTQVNRKWDLESGLDIAAGSCPKKVKFDVVAVVHPMVTWEFAYRNARCGPWEEMARDRERFRLRVSRVEPIIASVLTPEHREKVRCRVTLQSQ